MPPETIRSPVSIDFPGHVSAATAEMALEKFARQGGAMQGSVLIDLSDCSFIEVVSLMMLLSVLVARQEEGRETVIRLPKSKRVRDYFRSWNFPEAVASTTGRPFYRFVHKNDRTYFGENPDVSKQAFAGTLTRGASGWDRILSDRFFGFSVYIPPNEAATFRPKLAVDIASEWKRRAITSVLRKVFGGSEDLLSSRVIFEGVMNAIRHPSAKKIVIASQFQMGGAAKSVGAEPPPSHFTLCIWDDGRGIVETLRDAIDRESAISSIDPSDSFTSIYKLKLPGGEQRVPSTYVPSAKEPGYMLLFSSVLPGITSTLAPPKPKLVTTDEDHIQSPDVEVRSDPIFRLPGMGLYLLTNAVVQILGGSVAVRTGEYFMNIKGAGRNDPAEYTIKLTDGNPPLRGNLVTIRLPVHVAK